jgi:FKBP-type peptidyl-prolyl cis-trans isomerase
MGVKQNSQRVFILTIVVVFFLTSVAFTGFVIWDQVKKDDTSGQTALNDLPPEVQDQLNAQKQAQSQGENVEQANLESIDLVQGSGAEAVAGKTVKVHYTGTLKSDGSKFDSSLDRGEPFSFSLGSGQVIQGWDQGVVGMKVGGKRKLVIPASLAYGERSPSASIPPNSDLVFEIELLGVE